MWKIFPYQAPITTMPHNQRLLFLLGLFSVAIAWTNTFNYASSLTPRQKHVSKLQSEQNDANDRSPVPRRRGFLRRITGDSTPYEFPVREIGFNKTWPTENPFVPFDFSRLDYYNDGIFYSIPRLVYHIDEPAVVAITQHHRRSIPLGSDLLDLCSSWVSHYPVEFPQTMGKICATGMNALELLCNDQLTGGYQVLDLNQNPQLPYEDASFDVITCTASIDYLVDPIQILKECHRVLRPGGKVIISFSNRCFGLKAIRIWLRNRSDFHIELLNAFFQYAGGYRPRKVFEITAKLPQKQYQDPVYVIEACKS